MFPKITGYLSQDSATPWLAYAVVLNGYLQATNNKIACYIDVSTFIENESERKAIEGKVFSLEDLEALSKAKKYKFTEYGYFLEVADDATGKEYTGIIGQNREISLYDDIMEDYNLARGFKKFPDFTTIFPAMTDGSIDITKVQKRNTHFRGIGLTPAMLTTIAESFQQFKDSGSDYLRLEFFHAAKDKDKVDKVSAPILVTPFKSKFPTYKEAAVVMPVF